MQEEEMAQGLVYPPIDRVREISTSIAAAVAQTAIDEVRNVLCVCGCALFVC